MPFVRISILAAVATAVLAACGGGGGDAAPADKYVGTWTKACEIDGRASASGELTLNKASDNSLTGSLTVRGFNNTTCAGTPGATRSAPAAVTIDGTGTAEGKTVDKVTAVLGDEAGKDIFLVEGNRLFESPENSPKDAQGYPTTLDLASAWTKR
jgi:hypothetical protein